MRYFDGIAQTAADQARLSRQFDTIFDLMKDGIERTLPQIEQITGYPQASISAQLRHARKPRFGSHEVRRIYRGSGLYAYALIVNAESLCPYKVERTA